MTSAKWKERIDALTAVSDKLKTAPNNVIDGDFSSLLASLAKIISKDSNVNAVVAAAIVVENLAKGLGKKFAKNKSVVIGVTFERLKEAKQSVVDTLGNSLDAIAATVSPSSRSVYPPILGCVI